MKYRRKGHNRTRILFTILFICAVVFGGNYVLTNQDKIKSYFFKIKEKLKKKEKTASINKIPVKEISKTESKKSVPKPIKSATPVLVKKISTIPKTNLISELKTNVVQISKSELKTVINNKKNIQKNDLPPIKTKVSPNKNPVSSSWSQNNEVFVITDNSYTNNTD